MKKFKVKEKFIVEQWTFVEANSAEEAEKKLCDGQESGDKEISFTHESTDWKTLQETE